MESITRIHEIIADVCSEYRKGEEVTSRYDERGFEVFETFAMPPVPDNQAGRVLIDCHFIVVGVDIDKAEAVRDELAALLEPGRDMLSCGPSYIALGGWLGEQTAAFSLMALGEACGFWRLITPAGLGFEGESADHVAGAGYIFISGFTPDNRKPHLDINRRRGGPSLTRVEALLEASNNPTFKNAVDWLIDEDDTDGNRLHNATGEINMALDTAALLSASVLHSLGNNPNAARMLGNLYILRVGYHLGKLRSAAEEEEQKKPAEPFDVTCPHCQAEADAVLRVGADGPAKVNAGDVSICIRCGEIGVVDFAQPGRLRKPNGMELALIEEQPAVKAAQEQWRLAMLKTSGRADPGAVLH